MPIAQRAVYLRTAGSRSSGPLPWVISGALHELYERTHRIVFTLIMRAGDSRDLTTGVLRPEESLWLWVCLAHRTAKEGGGGPLLPATRQMSEPEWEEVAAGISCKLLSSDTGQQRASMLVRLAPGVDYPPHTHAGVEELHLLHGELWINDRKLYPGDYNRAEPGTCGKRVWSETGCTCLLITSTRDAMH